MAPVRQAWWFRPVISVLGWSRRIAGLEHIGYIVKILSQEKKGSKGKKETIGKGRYMDRRGGVGRKEGRGQVGRREGRREMGKGKGPVIKEL